MLPLVAIATSVIPDLIRLLAGDKAEKIARTVETVVADTTGTSDAAQARKLLEADPALAVQLREKLAAIALEETRLQNEREASARAAQIQSETAQRQHALEVLRSQLEADRIRRDQQFNEQQAQVRLALEQTAGARSLQMDLVKAGKANRRKSDHCSRRRWKHGSGKIRWRRSSGTGTLSKSSVRANGPLPCASRTATSKPAAPSRLPMCS